MHVLGGGDLKEVEMENVPVIDPHPTLSGAFDGVNSTNEPLPHSDQPHPIHLSGTHSTSHDLFISPTVC